MFFFFFVSATRFFIFLLFWLSISYLSSCFCNNDITTDIMMGQRKAGTTGRKRGVADLYQQTDRI